MIIHQIKKLKYIMYKWYTIYYKKKMTIKEGNFMKKTLVLAEKPSVGRDIARVL